MVSSIVKKVAALCSIMLVLSVNSCDDNDVSIAKGNIAFTFSSRNIDNNNGGRISETAIPAFLLISVEDDRGKKVETDKKISLHPFGERYITEDIELNSGNYKLTKFLVLDSNSAVIYATPLENADLAQFVSDPLPIHFSIAENTGSHVAPQVLAVSAIDAPGRFGYVSFDFEIADIPPTDKVVDLSVKAWLSQNTHYDSVYITFSNSDTVKKQRLTIDYLTNSASGMIKDLPVGNWNISISYFKALIANNESEIQNGSTTVTITPSTTNLFMNDEMVSLYDGNELSMEKIITWNTFFTFYLFNKGVLNAIVTLPADPLNPFFGISLLSSNWDYFYADRTFYDERPNEPGSHYVQGSAAFEKYNYNNTGIDYIDTTSFRPVTSMITNQTWDLADCLVIFYVNGEEQPVFYYQWFNGTSSNGRRRLEDFTSEQINIRKRTNLK